MTEVKNSLVGALVVTHGQLGQELVSAAQAIVGEISYIAPVSIGWDVSLTNLAAAS